jgi:hypothetical protein
VGVFINSSAGTQALVPLVDNSSTTWLTSNQDVLKSSVPGPEGQPGLPAPTLSSISVADSDLLFLWSDGSSFVVPLDSAIGTAVAAYLQNHAGDITFSPVTCVTDLALSGNVLTLAKSDSTNASLTLPAPILTASLSGTVLILNTSSGIFSVDLASVGVSQSTLTQMNQKPWYYFSPKAGARQNFMYTSTLNNPSYTASNTWKVETWIRLRSAYLNGYGTLLDTRSYPGAGGSDWFIFLIWGGTNGNFPALWSSSGGKGVSFNSGPFLKTNDWSHVVWQSSPSTGLQFLVDGVLAQTLSGQTPTFGVASDFCFGNVVDQVSNAANWVLRLDADVSQLMVRVGSTVDMYADGYTPPQSLSYVGQDKSDMVYIMPHGFKNMTLPANQVVEEFY